MTRDDARDVLTPSQLNALARERRGTLLMDEFYSHFIYTADGRPGAGPVSSAA